MLWKRDDEMRLFRLKNLQVNSGGENGEKKTFEHESFMHMIFFCKRCSTFILSDERWSLFICFNEKLKHVENAEM